MDYYNIKYFSAYNNNINPRGGLSITTTPLVKSV